MSRRTVQAVPPEPVDRRALDVLRPWLPGRRWYPAKGTEADLSVHAVVPFSDDVRVLLVRVVAGDLDTLLQVPVVLDRRLGPTVVGTLPEPGASGDEPHVLDGAHVHDGAGHPAFLRAWLAHADGPGTHGLDPDSPRVIAGEQSNTSVILAGPAGGGILKVLRAVQPGENPDVDVPRHLVDVGWSHVPAPLAWLVGSWTTPSGGVAHGYLGAMSAFVPAAEDGFELACAYAARAEPFDDLARDLGRVVATMHTALAAAYGLDPAPEGAREGSDALAARFAWASAAVPALAELRPSVDQVIAEVRALDSTGPRQRVHGDLHLGQVLRSQDRWFVTDFEGEPLAPLADRTRPDFAVRDVAGVLRSLEYAAAVGGLTGPTAHAWVSSARLATLEGYASESPGDEAARHRTQVLLRALELDKTLYEAVYESRNRPDWLPIPMAGLERLLG
ncbi:maltokinase N-terminal cap-like domain-containing protein [Cellulomonas massiliensis]|uniref:maltokinase N-terminal cap-like domain-containing protein n=1 Tax=Cellulomonas massiliensis TaxID=1465811 RepID=UPI0002DB1F02|nr:phosphotransferase [Cellulomonas massiliensis]